MTDKLNETPAVLVSTYGSVAPAAAKFGVGAANLAEIQEATAARRNQRPGDAEK